MKQNLLNKLFLCSIIGILFFIRVTYSVNPTYILTITNDQQIDNKNYEFDIYILQTGSTALIYSDVSQYYININSAIVNGGTLTFSLVAGTSDLTSFQQGSFGPLSYDNVNHRLVVATSQNNQSKVHSTTISSTSPGTRLSRFKVTNTNNFGVAQPNLSWYNGLTGSFTKIFAFVGATSTEITNSADHFVSVNNGPLPVALSKFNSMTNHNNVTLNWSTTYEINNSGFEVYRTLKDKDQWTKIGFVNGSGTTTNPVNYSFEDIKLQSAIYDYKLKQIDYNGNSEYFGLQNDVSITKPGDINLSQNYPNPSNPATNIDYQIPFDGKVSLKVYDLSGREVASLVNENKTSGYYTVRFDGTNLSSGVYFYKLQANGFTETKKMLMVK